MIPNVSCFCYTCQRLFSPDEKCHDPIENKRFNCTICKVWLNPMRLKDHLCFHSTNKQLKRSNKTVKEPAKSDVGEETDMCIFCSKEIRLSLLEEHENTHREEEKRRAKQHKIHIPKDGNTLCTICGASVLCKDLRKHERTHRRLGTVICSICGFPAKNIYQHMATHSEERRFSCQECGLAFKHKKNLDAHMLVHETVGKHKCSTCGKAFKTPYNLRVHIRSHQDVKPFPCQYCEKTFTTKQSRDNHMKTYLTHNL